ncbi:flagellar basal body P-ring formation chaperone FlgA [Pseudobdellovibrio exovorus]|uniref:Flagellar protein FlgA n=1 Tax=Pseudobdellovibrio exovorus JSS TaxID=1184267 RepID=M4V8K1_9BACT|nr:flagellar basal body P-ring formation chaperone FlgA [Pseudobdellovibrio exovorus]AGH94785.1 flagellar protein FlgA [Pseudobdellovibrio exovorus JSS]
MMNRVLSVFILMISSLAWATTEPEITIPSTVEVSPRQQISLNDVVEARNLDEGTMKSLQEIVIETDKQNGISKTELARLLRSVKARFILPSELKVIRSRGAISRMEVERKIKNKIYSDCNDCEVQIQIASVPTHIQSDWAMDLNIDMSKNNVMIPVYSTSNTAQKGWIIADIKRYQNVPVLRHSVKIGDVLTEDMFVTEKRQLMHTRDTVQSVEAVVGMQANRFISAGQLLRYSDVKKEQVLRRGQMVKAMFGGPDFEVMISAEAQEAGAIGDVVKIKNMDSQKVFAARIVERGLVRIE